MRKRTTNKLWQLVGLVIVLVIASYVAREQNPAPAPSSAPEQATLEDSAAGTPALPPVGDVWSVVQIYDGDTITVRRGNVTEDVRLIGIDTPERDACGYSEARDAMDAWVSGGTVVLVSGATTDRDSYDRLLRYVEVDGVDVGRALVEDGLARAWYDSRSGKPHPREDDYRAADSASADLCPW